MIEEVIKQFDAQAANTAPLGGTIKFMVDEHAVYIDGSGEVNKVSAENKEADCTITTSLEVLMKLKSGDINPMMAVMTGKVKIKGDMGLAMKLQSLI